MEIVFQHHVIPDEEDMFTDCPSCRRQFRLHARQLSAARGWVQCGYCGEQFNALERLHDQPQPRPHVSVPVIQEEAAAEKVTGDTAAAVKPPDKESAGAAPVPQPELSPDIPNSKAEKEKSPLSIEAENEEFPLRIEEEIEETPLRFETETDEVPPRSEGEAEGIPVRNEPQTREASMQAQRKVSVTAEDRRHHGKETKFEMPPVLEPEEEAPRRSRLSRVLWGLAVVLLLVITAAQVAWFNRDDLLTRYPQWMPLARRVCEYFQCSVIRHRDVSAIKLLNRDVRDHPRYQGALLVNATIANESNVIQPFPVVQLALFDTSGKLIGERKFRPDEYLDQSIDSDGGMPPGKPFHIVLEVTGPTQGAVSFEFHFLED
jgi:predicted Zn finger-like uncharacterized protein